jgi:hypothetical protein
MEKKKYTNTQTFFKSFINNRALFERRKNSILFPIIILILIISLLSVPSYISSNSVNGKTLMKSFPQIEEPMKAILTSSLDCTVEKGILKCSEDSPTLNTVISSDDIKYTVIVNQKSIALDTELSYSNKKDTDNLIILYSQTIRIRYSQRDHVNEKIKIYEIIGDYSTFEGFSIKKVSQKISDNPNLAKTEVENFILNTYKSTLDTQLMVNIASSITSFLLLVVVACAILKLPYLFRRKKGFKFVECFKIALTSALPSIFISLLSVPVFGFNMFAVIFGFLFVARITFIYFKYLFTNAIFKELYAQDKEERFNV